MGMALINLILAQCITLFTQILAFLFLFCFYQMYNLFLLAHIILPDQPNAFLFYF
jgi:hypothetical protein